MNEELDTFNQGEGVPIDLEAIVVTLLQVQRNKGVSYDDINRYKEILWRILKEKGIHRIYHGNSLDKMKELVKDYDREFRMFDGSIFYRPAAGDMNHVFKRYPDEVNNSFKEALAEYIKNEKVTDEKGEPKTFKQVPEKPIKKTN